MKRFILPNPKGARAHTLRHEALFIYTTFLILVQLALRWIAPLAPGILGYASNISVEAVTNWTNRYRIENNLQALQFNTKLAQAAKQKAEDMFEYNYWAHISPTGKEPWDFIVSEGYTYIYAGENLAKDFESSDEVVEAWMASQTHRENVLNSKYTQVGIAAVNGVLNGYETTLVVQMFGNPHPSAIEAQAAVPTPPIQTEPTPSIQTEPTQAPAETPTLSNVQVTPEITAIPEYSIEPETTTPLVPVIDVVSLVKSVAYTFGFFLAGLFVVDIITATKHGITRVTGNSLAHLGLVLLLLGATWYTSLGTVL